MRKSEHLDQSHTNIRNNSTAILNWIRSTKSSYRLHNRTLKWLQTDDSVRHHSKCNKVEYVYIETDVRQKGLRDWTLKVNEVIVLRLETEKNRVVLVQDDCPRTVEGLSVFWNNSYFEISKRKEGFTTCYEFCQKTN